MYRQRAFKQRLDKVERLIRREQLATCICQEWTGVDIASEFELEMNRPCPVHGLRSLGELDRIMFVKGDGSVVEDPELDRLIEIYEERQRASKLKTF